MKILVIEDYEDAYFIVEETLSDLYDLKHANCLESAKALLEKEPFDLILCDVNLPDGDGIRFCSHIRELIPEKTLFIFVTGEGHIEQKVHGFAVGGIDYIVKPFHVRELRARVKAHLTSLEKTGS